MSQRQEQAHRPPRPPSHTVVSLFERAGRGTLFTFLLATAACGASEPERKPAPAATATVSASRRPLASPHRSTEAAEVAPTAAEAAPMAAVDPRAFGTLCVLLGALLCLLPQLLWRSGIGRRGADGERPVLQPPSPRLPPPNPRTPERPGPHRGPVFRPIGMSPLRRAPRSLFRSVGDAPVVEGIRRCWICGCPEMTGPHRHT